MSLNIEGICMSKYDHISKPADKYKALRETLGGEDLHKSRYSITGNIPVSHINHNKYGLMTYAKNPTLATEL